MLDAAQDYHYRAAILSEECSDTSFTARKNRVVSLNGIGNIYLTIGNLDLADSVFRLALDGERKLHSTVGQAINYANIGSIFESRRQTDSAWVYYRKSMAMNEEAGNTLGISLCHTYFGSLHEKAGEYADAAEEYEAAYSLMRESRDSWHALNSLISLAGLSVATGNTAKAANYLERACRRAEHIKSNEHLAEIYTLYYRLHKKEGDYRNALYCLETADAQRDSLMNMEKINRIQNISLNLERGLRERETEKADLMLRQERAKRSAAYFFFGIVVVVLLLMIAMLLYAQRLRVRSQRMLRKMAELRETFFTNITHEFRTPLTVILGLSRRMRDDSGLPEDAREKSGTIERMGNGLLLLVNQLLDISKIRSAVGDPDWRHGDVTARMRIVTMMYHSYAGDCGVGLSFEAREAVVIDYVPDYVDKVLNNHSSSLRRAARWPSASGERATGSCSMCRTPASGWTMRRRQRSSSHSSRERVIPRTSAREWGWPWSSRSLTTLKAGSQWKAPSDWEPRSISAYRSSMDTAPWLMPVWTTVAKPLMTCGFALPYCLRPQ